MGGYSAGLPIITSGGSTESALLGHIRDLNPSATPTLRITSNKPNISNIDPEIVFAIDSNSFNLGWNGTSWDRLLSESGTLLVKDSGVIAELVAANLSLVSINNKIPSLGVNTSANSMPVVLASDQSPIPVTGTFDVNLDAFSVTPDNVMTVGTIDGTKTGAKYGFVNNIRNQILASHDREQNITYADFGNKNQRVTQIDYISPTFSGITARKVLTYTLVGTKYRRDSINWVII